MTAGPGRGNGEPVARRRRPWLLPIAALTMVVVVGVTVLAIGLLRPDQLASAPAASTAAPAPAAAAAAARSLSSPAPQTSAQEHQQYRNYVSTVVIDATAVVASTGNLAGCRSDRTECVSRLKEAGHQVRAFQADLAKTPAPACLSKADDLLRDGLGFLSRGFDMAQKGVNSTNRVQVVQGILLLTAGWWRGGQAISQARESSC
jgi:hypothetical protein